MKKRENVLQIILLLLWAFIVAVSADQAVRRFYQGKTWWEPAMAAVCWVLIAVGMTVQFLRKKKAAERSHGADSQ